jgi:hypothetical protein
LFIGRRFDNALGMGVDGGATIVTVFQALRYGAPNPTEYGGSIANLLCHR